MTRLKLPAYGKQLLERRRAGDHPLEVAFILGEDWRDGQEPRLCINPQDYEPGRYDFRVVAGTRVLVLDQALGAGECDENARPPTFGKFYDLIGELAEFAAVVEIEWPLRSGWMRREIQEMAWTARWYDPSIRRMIWPRWWSDERNTAYSDRFEPWIYDCAGVGMNGRAGAEKT
jgi:hypothetical protein